MLYRHAWEKLALWKSNPHKKALLLTGARQIGKTTLVRAFAAQEYRHFFELNFLTDPLAVSIFDGPLDANTLVANITAYAQTALIPGQTLILLDEIQECPRARTAIKFLVEDGRFDYVETGSLLGVKTKLVPSYPVGFEEPFRMYPMSFKEYCLANGVQPQTIESLHEHFVERRAVPQASHEVMMRLWRSYIIVGGMPEVVQRYIDTHDIAQVVGLQRDILALYRQDIAKYAERNESAKVCAIFDAIPSQLDDKNRRFVLADLSKTARQNRYESSFLWLADAGVALPCYNVNAPVLPLEGSGNHSLFKLFLSDAGLLCAASMENVQFDILSDNLEVNLGSILENIVAQELVSHGLRLYYHNSKRHGEVDFVVQMGSRAVPIEVKSGNSWTAHKALDNIMGTSEWDIPEAFVLCKGNVRQEGRTVYLPLYMSMFIEAPQIPESMPFDIDLSALDELG